MWYALGAGDTDILRPIFNMYMGQQPVLEERSRQWWRHNGTQFGETSYFFGTYEPVDYGCGRAGVPDCANPYIRHHYEGGVELAVMMLRAFYHTQDQATLTRYVLPWCQSLLTFYDEHYPKYPNGTMFLQHAQSCETWPDCDNPAAQVSALHRIAEGLVGLPPDLVSSEQRAFFARVARSLPAIPLTRSPGGRSQVSPCQGGFPARHVNAENVETYAIWPYEFFSVNRTGAQSSLAVGLETFNNVHFGHGNSAWRYDGQDAALLGLAPYAWDFIRSRVEGQGRCENSRFPGYLAADPSDGAPQVESNGIVAVTLQKMLLQTDGRRILLFPAFLEGLDVDMRLHAPGVGQDVPPAAVRAVLRAGRLVHLAVTPASRQGDVVVLPRQAATGRHA